VFSVEPLNFRNVSDPQTTQHYKSEGWWGEQTIADLIADLADRCPDAAAFITAEHRL
jgi:non-ribosomal peptide synthetase component E (peptide arylation enzyme)